MTIYFYTPADEFGAFSNFSKHGVEMDGFWFRTVEHYFQSQKFEDPVYREKIRLAATAKNAANLGRSRSYPIRSDWDAVKDSIMLDAVQKKFRTHREIKALLLSTGNQELVENAPGDYYWGCGQDGSGLNRLGHILMEVRAGLANDGPGD